MRMGRSSHPHEQDIHTMRTKFRPSGITRREARAGIVLVAPAILLFIFLRLFPTLYAFYLSFSQFNMVSSPKWVGAANYAKMLTDTGFHISLQNTLVYTFSNVLISAAVALGFALLLNRKIKGVGIFRSIYYIPQITSWIALSMIWTYLLNPPFGLVNYLLNLIGLPKLAWLSSPTLAMPTIIMIAVWRNVGYDIVIYLAALQGIQPVLFEAAEIDGANSWQKFWYITWRLLLPTTTYILIMTGIFSLQAFDQIFQMTMGGPADATITVVLQIYRQAFQFGQMGYACAMAFVLFVTIFILSAISLRFSGQMSGDDQ